MPFQLGPQERSWTWNERAAERSFGTLVAFLKSTRALVHLDVLQNAPRKWFTRGFWHISVWRRTRFFSEYRYTTSISLQNQGRASEPSWIAIYVFIVCRLWRSLMFLPALDSSNDWTSATMFCNSIKPIDVLKVILDFSANSCCWRRNEKGNPKVCS